MKVSEILSKAADLIEPEGKWTTVWCAVDKNGVGHLNGNIDSAVCWCAIGAVERIAGGYCSDSTVALSFVRDVIGEHVDIWNDEAGRTQSEVVSALREASTLAKEQEAS